MRRIGCRADDGNRQFIAWGKPGGGAGIALTEPFDGNPASVGNGIMVALEAKDRDQVQRLYDIALSHGGSDEGAPGPRGEADENGLDSTPPTSATRTATNSTHFCMDKVS